MPRAATNCISAIFLAAICPTIRSQSLTRQEACSPRFQNAVVRIDGGGEIKGTGFIVSEDGLIVTANHVVRNQEGRLFSFITATLPDGRIEVATPAITLSPESIGQDYAVLKISVKDKLPFLEIGSSNEIQIGDDLTIIGFPFSATGSNLKFCLAAIAASKEQVTQTVTWKYDKAPTATTLPVQVDIVYFQGPSVKGISGGPIISRSTGHVVAIENMKLTGLGPALDALKNSTANRSVGTTIDGLNPNMAVNQILTLLDNQLANGLGAAVSIDNAKDAIRKMNRKRK
jgi:S1-C subfamily serine protease